MVATPGSLTIYKDQALDSISSLSIRISMVSISGAEMNDEIINIQVLCDPYPVVAPTLSTYSI